MRDRGSRFKEEARLVRIHAAILVERDNQKRVPVGRGGSMLRTVGTEAPLPIEGPAGHIGPAAPPGRPFVRHGQVPEPGRRSCRHVRSENPLHPTRLVVVYFRADDQNGERNGRTRR